METATQETRSWGLARSVFTPWLVEVRASARTARERPHVVGDGIETKTHKSEIVRSGAFSVPRRGARNGCPEEGTRNRFGPPDIVGCHFDRKIARSFHEVVIAQDVAHPELHRA